MIFWLSFLSPQKQPTVQFNYSFIGTFCVFWLWRVYSSMFWTVYAILYGVPLLHAVNFVRVLSPHLLDARTFQSCRTPTIRSLFVIVCTQVIPIATAFFIAWNFKAQSTPVPRLVQKFYGFCRGRETSLVPVALISFISIVGILSMVHGMIISN